MNIPTIIALAAVVLVVFLALRYIIKQKKKGVKCIGCPHAGTCPSCSSHSSSHCEKCKK